MANPAAKCMMVPVFTPGFHSFDFHKSLTIGLLKAYGRGEGFDWFEIRPHVTRAGFKPTV